jgi:hypothetical protein
VWQESIPKVSKNIFGIKTVPATSHEKTEKNNNDTPPKNEE